MHFLFSKALNFLSLSPENHLLLLCQCLRNEKTQIRICVLNAAKKLIFFSLSSCQTCFSFSRQSSNFSLSPENNHFCYYVHAPEMRKPRSLCVLNANTISRQPKFLFSWLKMETFQVRLCFFILAVMSFMTSIHVSTGQLAPSEARVLFQVQKLLEYPEPLWGWSNWTNFCYLPPSPSLKIVCSNGRVTELTVTGKKSSPETLSKQFSIDTFFTALTKLSNLKVLSLVSLGLWGPLPDKIDRFWSLQVLNMSSNSIYGELPSSVSSLVNLKSIVLADNVINGSVPDLRALVGLQELNLGGNKIGPEFPSLGNKLVTIIFRNNSLRSEVPDMIKKLGQLQQLDISDNKVFGMVPAFLFSLPSIHYINLAQNQLSGAFPTNISCSNSLKFTDISQNLLMGKLGSCVGSRTLNRTVLYSWNCFSSEDNLKYQHPNSYCQKQAVAVKPASKSQEEEQESTLKLGFILGIIGGSLGVAGTIGLLVLAIFRRVQARKAEDKSYRFVADKMSVHGSQRSASEARRAPATMGTIGLPPYHVFSLEEIEDATNYFDPSNFLGEDSQSQGQIYKGWLRDGSVVQVRSVKLKQKQLPQSLVKHMEAVSKLRHRHLVSVLGHCIVASQDHPNAGTTVFIVLENISNGTLKDYLTDRRKKERLKWTQRMSISISIARGVQFLHTGMAPGVFGNNLKVENILLDDNLLAKISGYNIPVPSQIGSESPLNGRDASNVPCSENEEKDDIYRLGAILVELITGKLAASTDELDELKLQLEKSLTEGVSGLRGTIDPSIRGTFAYQSLRTVAEITVNCIGTDTSKRPSIEDVLWNLQYAFQVQESWNSSENLSTQAH